MAYVLILNFIKKNEQNRKYFRKIRAKYQKS